VPRHVTRLVVDYFAYTARPGASARRAARRAAHCQLRLHHASECLGTSRDSSRSSSSTTSPTLRVRVPRHVAQLVAPLVVNFDYAARPSASTRHVARRRLLRLRRASGCLGTSRGSLSTSSPTLRVRVPRHVARLVVDYFTSHGLVIYYFAYAEHPSASARRTARHRPHVVSPLDFSSVGRTGSHCAPDRSFSRLDYSVPPLDLLSGHTGSTSATPCVTTSCLVATVALLRVCCALPRRHLPVASRRPFISTSFPN
jgi:hypothetical protein